MQPSGAMIANTFDYKPVTCIVAQFLPDILVIILRRQK